MALCVTTQEAWLNVTPDVLILGQITVDDTVPAEPGMWYRRLGGNALYAAAGARLWSRPGGVGVVARAASRLPFDVRQILTEAGLSADGLVAVDVEPMNEWVMYEEDGNRQSMPRYAPLRDPAASIEELFRRYLRHMEELSASYEDIPAKWLPAKAVHLSPQVLNRHGHSCQLLAGKTAFLSVDPSPHYARSRGAGELVAMLPGVHAFLPSQAEVEHLGEVYPDWPSVAIALRDAGFAEVLLKRGGAGALLAVDGTKEIVPLPVAKANVADLTGAGDAFSGAYAASRGLGYSPLEAGARAAVAAAMVVECSGAQQAFALRPEDAETRLREYLVRG
jgi:sugar/nucleoside kinase (ribokinase family)